MSEATSPVTQLAPASKTESQLHAIGSLVLGGWAEVRDLYSLFVRTLYYCVKGRREKGDVLKQMYEIGNRSLGFLCVTMGFIGMILFYQSGSLIMSVLPEKNQLGPNYIELMVRDLGASIGALMLATRVGAGIAAEIGSMVVTEQVDALRMTAADPIDFLVVPRFLGSILASFCTLLIATVVAIVAGFLTGLVFFDIPAEMFFNMHLIGIDDLLLGCVKALAYGATIPIVSAHAGFSAHGGSEGVGWATTRAVVNSSLAILMLNASISALSFVVFS